MDITRREVLEKALLGGVALAVLASVGFTATSVLAEDAPAGLNEPGPLPDMAIGSKDASVTVIEYASMTCPHCAHFSQTTFPELKKRYIDTGKVRFIFREFPLDDLAAGAFLLARCNLEPAAADTYIARVELLFQTQRTWAVEQPLDPLFNVMKQAGLTRSQFEKCLNDQAAVDKVRASRDQGVKVGVNATPTFFINGKKVGGALEIDAFEKELAPFLKS